MSAGKLKGEVLKSVFSRVGGMGLGFASNYFLLKQLGASDYGTWATLVSLLVWVQLSDFGVGYALKNRIASASDKASLLPVIVGVFFFYCVLALFIFFAFLLVGRELSIVQQHPTESLILYLGVISFFPLTIGSAVLQGLSKNSISSFLSFAQATIWLAIVLLLQLAGPGFLILSLSYVALILIIGFWQCFVGLRQLDVSKREFAIEFAKGRNIMLALPLWGVGLKFILLQLSALGLFSFGTYLTYSYSSPAEAAKYDVLFKFFQLPVTLFSMIVTVYWPEISKSLSENNQKALLRKYRQLLIIAGLGVCGSFLASFFLLGPVVSMYSHAQIDPSKMEVSAFWAMVSLQIIAYCGAVFLNAAEKLNGQILIALVAAIVLIPFSYFFHLKGLGFLSVPLATAILLVPSAVYCNFSAYSHVIKKNR